MLEGLLVSGYLSEYVDLNDSYRYSSDFGNLYFALYDSSIYRSERPKEYCSITTTDDDILDRFKAGAYLTVEGYMCLNDYSSNSGYGESVHLSGATLQ